MRGKIITLSVCIIAVYAMWIGTLTPGDEFQLVVLNRGHFMSVWVEHKGEPVMGETLSEALELIVTLPGGEAVPVFHSEGHFWVLVPQGVHSHEMHFKATYYLQESKIKLYATPKKPLYLLQ